MLLLVIGVVVSAAVRAVVSGLQAATVVVSRLKAATAAVKAEGLTTAERRPPPLIDIVDRAETRRCAPQLRSALWAEPRIPRYLHPQVPPQGG